MANLYPENLYFEDAEIGTSLLAGPYLVTKSEIIQFAKQYDTPPHRRASRRALNFWGADRMRRPYLLHLRFVDDPASATTPCPCWTGLG